MGEHVSSIAIETNKWVKSQTLMNRAQPGRGGFDKMPELYIYMHMRTTINIDDALLSKARKLTGISEKTALVQQGLQALIAQASSKRLAQLGGSEKSLQAVPRRRAQARR